MYVYIYLMYIKALTATWIYLDHFTDMYMYIYVSIYTYMYTHI